MEEHDYSEGWMVAALASIFANWPRRDLGLQLSQILAPWDMYVDIGRCDNLAIMIHVKELARINDTIFTMDHIDIASLRLMLGDSENGRTASHWISRDVARRVWKHFIESRKSLNYYRGTLELDILPFAEDLLQDVHQNPILLETGKTALENALCIQLVDGAKSKALSELIPPGFSWSDYQKLWKLSAEQVERSDCAGQAEQERLMALLSNWRSAPA
jgi:hypothetical protein